MRSRLVPGLAVVAGTLLLSGGCGDAPREIVQPPAAPRAITLAARIVVVAGAAQLGVAGEPLRQPIVVRVLDPAGKTVAGAPVTWTVLAGGGSTDPATGAADANGVARAAWTLGPSQGDNLLQVTSGAATVLIQATAAAAGAVYTLEKVEGDAQTGPAGMPLAQRLTVRARRADGTPAGGVAVVWSTPDGGQVTGVQPTTALDGTAQAGWQLGTETPAQTATATVGAATVTWSATATGVRSGSLRITPASPLALQVGDVRVLAAHAYDAAGSFLGARPAEWSSSSPAVVSVDGQGAIMAVGVGRAYVRAKAEGKADSIRVEVSAYAPPKVVRITPNRSPVVAQFGGYGSVRFAIEFSRPLTGMSMTVRGPRGTTLFCRGTSLGGYNTPFFNCAPRLAKGVEPGIWRVVSIGGSERSHPPFTYDAAALSRAGTTGLQFEVISTLDVTRPEITSVELYRSWLVDPTDEPGLYPVSLHVTDDLSGVMLVVAMARSKSGRQTARCELYGVPVAIGTNPNDGNWFCWLRLPADAERGAWYITLITATDVMRNTTALTTAGLRERGFRTDFYVR